MAAVLGQTPILLNGNVFDGAGGPLLGGNVYHIVGSSGACGITVPGGQTLTIQPGAIVKVGGCWGVSGRVLAPGTANAPIIVTSIHDDSAGGDTNQNGAATVPSPGDWHNVDVLGDGSAWSHAQFRFGGNPSHAAINQRGRPATYRNCRFLDFGNTAVANAGGSIFDTCAFHDCVGIPVTGMSLATLAQCLDNTTVNCGADYFLVQYTLPFSADVQLLRRNALNGMGVLVLDVPNVQAPVIPAGRTLSIEGGLTLKFVRGNVRCNGRILAQGSVPPFGVVFTSFRDDVFGGDTNRDGNATQGTPGDWGGITLAAGDTSRFDWASIRFAGGDGRALRIEGSSAVLQVCAVSGSSTVGISFGATATPRASLRDTWVFDCLGQGIRDIPWSTLAASSRIQCSNNAGGNHVSVGGETITQPTILDKNCILGVDPVLESLGSLAVDAGGVLELPAGTIVKRLTTNTMTVRNGGELRLMGTARRPVVFTSFRDDSIGGDTNRDGGATLPAPGNWSNFNVIDGGRVRFENVLLRYGGGNATLAISGTGVSHLLRVRIERSLQSAFALAAVGTADNLVAWNNGADGIQCTGGAFALRHATAANNAGFGIRRPSAQFTGQVVNCIAHGNAAGNFGLLAAQVSFSNGGFAGSNGNLAVDPVFVNAAAGDLRLQAGSPCVGVADLGTALAVGRDFDEFPRVLDPALTGATSGDMGAHERAAFALVVVGEPRPGFAPLQLTVQGPPGLALFGLGLLDGPPFWLLPYGSVMLGNTFASIGSAPTGTAISYPIPGFPGILGLDVAVQAFGIAGGAALTNVDRWRIWG
ncbi:MAG: hypothetical protein IPK26_05590 [Planctomycetes bacterium]|nr:hypothetical protein [Planctomycetota bacterium]